MADLPFGLESRPHEKIDPDDPDQTELHDFEADADRAAVFELVLRVDSTENDS